MTIDEMFQSKTKNMYGVMYVNPAATHSISASPDPIIIPRLTKGDELDWKLTYSRHYRLFDRIIRKTKVVEQLIKLNYADINQLDFSRPYWFDRYNQLFVLDEVIQYKLNQTDSTMCRFIRI